MFKASKRKGRLGGLRARLIIDKRKVTNAQVGGVPAGKVIARCVKRGRGRK